MIDKDIDKLINITKDFYLKVGFEFDQTRKNSWSGWDRLIEIIKKDKRDFSVADIGCGNGRFLEFLLNSKLAFKNYCGFDSSDFLLNKALQKFSSFHEYNISFSTHDCIKHLNEINEKFDFVVAFGITHHIPSYEFRKEWFNDLGKLVKDNGVLIFSNWRINSIKNFKDKIERLDVNLEKNDYILGWGDSNARRYVHIFDDEEMKDIISNFEKSGFQIVNRYYADGRTNELNEYFIFRKC